MFMPRRSESTEPNLTEDNVDAQDVDTSTASLSRARSRVACQACHRRKVRCDVTKTSVPCTNCQHDDARCEVLPRKKHRYEVCSSATEDMLGYTSMTDRP